MTSEVIDKMKQFQLFVPFTPNQHSVDLTKNYTENDDGRLTIEWIAVLNNTLPNIQSKQYIIKKVIILTLTIRYLE